MCWCSICECKIKRLCQSWCTPGFAFQQGCFAQYGEIDNSTEQSVLWHYFPDLVSPWNKHPHHLLLSLSMTWIRHGIPRSVIPYRAAPHHPALRGSGGIAEMVLQIVSWLTHLDEIKLKAFLLLKHGPWLLFEVLTLSYTRRLSSRHKAAICILSDNAALLCQWW